MLDLSFPLEYVAFGLLGVGAFVAVSAGLTLLRKGRRGPLEPLLFGVFAAVAATVHGGMGRLLLLFLCAVFVSFVFLRSAGLRHVLRRGLTLLDQPRVQAAFLLLLSPALVWGWVCQIDAATRPADVELPAGAELTTPPLHQTGQGYTDRGCSVPLYGPAEAVSLADLHAREAEQLRILDLSRKLIQTLPADSLMNCHGWVFSGGRGWIKGEEVEAILRDNGYFLMSAPQPGDLIVYRNDQGAINHSGIVRAVWEGDEVLVESKWGMIGCYLHGPDGQSYGTRYTYHRSARTGHRLRGLDHETPPLWVQPIQGG